VSQIFQMKESVKAMTGQQPNSILIGWRAHNRLMRNWWARTFVKGINNGGGAVSRQDLQSMFEMDRYLVSEALWHTQNEGQATTNAASMALVNPLADEIIVYFAPDAPSRDDPSWMYSFRWNNPALPAPMSVFRHPYDSRRQVDTIEAGYYQDERIVGTDYAVRMNTVIASGALGLG
jgi:hypothetical protein